MTDFTPNPDGSQKIIQGTLLALNLDTNIFTRDGKPIGKTGKGVQIIINSHGKTQTFQVPSSLLSGTAAQYNQELIKDLKADLPLGQPATVILTMSKGFWSVKSIKSGHVGVPGVALPGQTVKPQAQSKAKNNVDWDKKEQDIMAGQIVNLAMSAVATEGVVNKESLLSKIKEIKGYYLELKEAAQLTDSPQAEQDDTPFDPSPVEEDVEGIDFSGDF